MLGEAGIRNAGRTKGKEILDRSLSSRSCPILDGLYGQEILDIYVYVSSNDCHPVLAMS